MKMCRKKINLDWKLTSKETERKNYLSKIGSNFVDIYGKYKALEDNKGISSVKHGVINYSIRLGVTIS